MDKYSEALLVIMGTLIATKLGVLAICTINELIKARKTEENKLEEKSKN